jgi:hypothetical protein
MSDEFGDVMESIPTDTLRESNNIEDLSHDHDEDFSANLNSVKFLDMLESETAIGDFADKLNPEMKSQVLVPLANLLDKYGFSDKLGTSQTTQSAFNVIGLLSDIAPVIKGLSDYVSGQRNALSDEDQMFLNEISKAQSSGDFSDLFSSEDSEMLEIGSSEPEQPKQIKGTGLNDGPIDWYEMMGLENPKKKAENEMRARQEALFGDVKPAKEKTVNSEGYVESTKAKLPTLEELMAEAGVNQEIIDNADSYKNPQNPDQTLENEREEIDILNTDIGLEILEEAMAESEIIDYFEEEE